EAARAVIGLAAVDECREGIEVAVHAPVASEETAVEQHGNHEQADEAASLTQAAALLRQALVAVEHFRGWDRLIGPRVPQDELATGLLEGVQVQTHRVALHPFGDQPPELGCREAKLGDRGGRAADRVAKVLQVAERAPRSGLEGAPLGSRRRLESQPTGPRRSTVGPPRPTSS